MSDRKRWSSAACVGAVSAGRDREITDSLPLAVALFEQSQSTAPITALQKWFIQKKRAVDPFLVAVPAAPGRLVAGGFRDPQQQLLP